VVESAAGRYKVRLLVKERDGDLRIEGRDQQEWVAAERVRPVQPADQRWGPTLGESCEFLYLDGWWPVRAKRMHKTKTEGEKWEVVYEAYGNSHRATRDKLRPIRVWDDVTKAFREP